jgi:hypothetical protein
MSRPDVVIYNVPGGWKVEIKVDGSLVFSDSFATKLEAVCSSEYYIQRNCFKSADGK